MSEFFTLAHEAEITVSHQFGTLAASQGLAMADDPIISMTMASEDENVLLVREALVGLARALDLDVVTLEDILTAVTRIHAARGRFSSSCERETR